MTVCNAQIKSTMLGVEDHGIFTAFLDLEFDSGGQGFGGFALDAPPPNRKGERVGIGFGIDFIKAVLSVVGVDKWEAIPGKLIRVKHDDSESIVAIGHFMREQWFNPSEMAAQWRKANGN